MTERYALVCYWEQKTSELTTQQKREARAMCFGVFGQKTEFFTGQPINPRLLHMGVYDLHHLVEKGSPGCNLLPNLRLAYHGPNANSGKATKRSAIQIQNKDKIPPDATTELRQLHDYSTGPAPMAVNGDAEPDYRRRIWELLEYGRMSMTKERAIYGLAELIGISPQATRDYLKKMTSEDGPLEEYREMDARKKAYGPKRIKVKEHFRL